MIIPINMSILSCLTKEESIVLRFFEMEIKIKTYKLKPKGVIAPSKHVEMMNTFQNILGLRIVVLSKIQIELEQPSYQCFTGFYAFNFLL